MFTVKSDSEDESYNTEKLSHLSVILAGLISILVLLEQ